MLTPILRTTLAAALLAGTALTSNAAEVFNRIATFNVVDNLPEGADPKKSTVAEIITATPDGNRLVYTDSPGERIGIVDITDPKAPKAAGTVALDGEPTSTVVLGNYALVGVVTSKSKAEPSGHLAIVDLAARKRHRDLRSRRPARFAGQERRRQIPRHRHRE